MQNFQSEQDIRSSVDEQLKNLGWFFKGANRNVFQEQPREDGQKKKLKGKRPDYVLYSSKEKYRKEPLMIIETKKPGANLNDALGQGNWYAEQLQASLVFATDGIYYKTLHSKIHKPLYLNGEEVNELIRELEAIKFLENNEVDTISKEVQYDRKQLINIFEESNNLLREEGLRAGIERFGEFANILFLKLVGEIEDLKEEEGKDDKVVLDRYLRWSQWKNKKDKELLKFINNTVLQEIAKAYKDDKIFSQLSIRNPRVLERIIDKLEPLKLINIDSDIKGDAFEYFLQKSTATKNDLGEYFTPRHIVKTMVKLVNPQFGERVYDPFCGTGGMLIETFKHIYNTMPRNPHNLKALQNETIFGNEITSTARITKMNMILIGDGHSGVRQKNSLADPYSIENKYDAVITNMPYSQKTDYGSYYDLPSNNGDSICVQHCIKAIDEASENGRMAIIVPEGFLFRKDMQGTREYLLDRCYLKSVISLPQGVFLPYTGVKTNILYCTDIKRKKKQERFWYFDVKDDGYSLDSHRRKLEGENDLQKFLAHRNTDIQEKRDILSIGFSEINMKEVRKNDLILVGNRYRQFIDYDNILYKTVKLSEVAKVGAGNPAPQDQKLFKDGKHPFFRVSDVAKYHITDNLIESSDKLNGQGIKGLKKYPKGTILFPKSGASTFLNHRAILGIAGYVSSHLATIEPLEDKIFPKYLFYLLRGIDAKNLTIDQNYPSLKLSTISNLKVPLPPIAKQKEIVNELEGYQRIIDGARQIINSYRPQIDINKNWKSVELGNQDLFEIRLGGTPDSKNKNFWGGNINWVTLTDLPADNFITEIFESKRKITQKGLDSSSAKLLPKNTVVVSSRATIGRVGIARKELATNQGFKNIVIKKPRLINEKYVAYIMTTLVEKMNLMASGGTFKEISKTSFEKLIIPLPSKKVQDGFVKKIDIERVLIEANKKTIKLFENKIHEKLNLIWGR